MMKIRRLNNTQSYYHDALNANNGGASKIQILLQILKSIDRVNFLGKLKKRTTIKIDPRLICVNEKSCF